MPMSHDQRWDAIVVGAGHNGLTAGAILAKAGLATLVLERREVIGGACVTEEVAPGCRASTAAYIASMLRPEVIRALELGRHGLRMVPCEPAVQVAVDGGEVLAHWNDPARTRAEIARYSERDARAFADVTAELRQLSARLQPLLTELPPDTGARSLRAAGERAPVSGGSSVSRGWSLALSWRSSAVTSANARASRSEYLAISALVLAGSFQCASTSPPSTATCTAGSHGTIRKPCLPSSRALITSGRSMLAMYEVVEARQPGATSSVTQAPPITSRRWRTSVARPALASMAPAVSPLCPAPTTIASHR